MNWTDVEGYFSYSYLYDLPFKNCPEDAVFVEIGSWMGRSTCYMAEKIKKSPKSIKFYAVDTWDGSDEEEHQRIVQELKDNNSSLYEIFKSNLQKCEVEEYVVPLQSSSIEAAGKFEDNSIDFVHIDASHDYHSVLSDIIAWYPKVKPGGFISGDDYVENWGGVIQAVNEFFKGKSSVLLNRQDNTLSKVWVHQKQGEKMEVTLYAIAKNEEKNVERFIENSKRFSHTVVVDTGSTDNTIQLLQGAGIEVHSHPQSREEFDFSVARNTALSYVKTDWAFSLDFNEDVENFFPGSLDVISGEFTAFNHERYDKLNENEPTQSREVHIRFHRTGNYTWVNAVHEIPSFIPTEDFPNESVVDTTMKITKLVRESVDKKLFYLSICEREYEKDKNNWYYLWFIFNHYHSVGNISKAIEFGREFLDITKPYFNELRIRCFTYCSELLIVSGDVPMGANYAFHALSEAMNFGNHSLGEAFKHLIRVGEVTKNPNITVFSTGFSELTMNHPSRKEAIRALRGEIE